MNDKKIAKALIENKSLQSDSDEYLNEDIHYKDEDGRTYLHLSVFLESISNTVFLIDNGVDVNAKDRDNVTALHRACKIGCIRSVKLLIDAGADLGTCANGLVSPLHVAAANGWHKCVALLLDWIEAEKMYPLDDQLHSPLHYACAEGHYETAKVLIDHNFDVNQQNASGNTPLHFAAAAAMQKLCQLLIDSHANIDLQNNSGQTALHIATLQGCAHTVVELLNHGGDPNVRDSNGNTCSHIALKNGETEIIYLLMLDPRTDPSIQDKEENTVLHNALKSGHYNLIPNMLPRARDLTKQDASGCSVIFEAIRNQLEDLAVEMLKACPLLAQATNIELVTPLHLAAERGMRHLTRELLINGAKVDAVDCNGLTPSLYCAKNDAVLECLGMIEDIMISDSNLDQLKTTGQNNSKRASRISS